MMRQFCEETLLIATHNKGKGKEIADLLSKYIKKYITAADLNLLEPEETGKTFSENAILKAREASKASGHVCLADDSGLCVYALNGDPGIYSARWGGPKKDFSLAMQRVDQALGDQIDRSAAFVCVLALAWPDGHVETFEGRIEGNLIWPPRGDKGFGYDPMFVPEGYEMTFAEMDSGLKQSISHRARAFEKLVQSCFHE